MMLTLEPGVKGDGRLHLLDFLDLDGSVESLVEASVFADSACLALLD